MFGNVVYYDKKKIDEYRSVIKGQRNLEQSGDMSR